MCLCPAAILLHLNRAYNRYVIKEHATTYFLHLQGCYRCLAVKQRTKSKSLFQFIQSSQPWQHMDADIWLPLHFNWRENRSRTYNSSLVILFQHANIAPTHPVHHAPRCSTVFRCVSHRCLWAASVYCTSSADWFGSADQHSRESTTSLKWVCLSSVCLNAFDCFTSTSPQQVITQLSPRSWILMNVTFDMLL